MPQHARAGDRQHGAFRGDPAADSALNDTIQQAGAARGIAVLGSVLASAYTAAMPATAPDAARLSIGNALSLGDAGIARVAREAFTTAMSSAFLISAAGVVAAAVLALLVMPKKTALS
ncbi:hypothetical protein [Nonomuraea sp. NPDC049784]|uniref:hypothetical protein n=1 Tax=Nonomuraea sp. NPDC049784 TaxID=3154361 RepID=UPI00340C2C31